MNLADNIKKIRKEHNLSQEQFAEKLNVSRQSVSKWESGLAYPEMDKVLQICKMFNINIDELFNQDIKEVNNNKQSKNVINKYIDDFLNYVTKTIDMLSSFTFKQKIKCLFEQFIIAGVLLLIFLIIGAIFGSIFRNIFSILPSNIYYVFYNLFSDIYIVLALIVGIVLVLHIFRVRYLDYYVIVKNNEISEETKEIQNNEANNQDAGSKVFLEKKKEKIIIRDPNHSEYKFISGLLKFIIISFKVIALFIALIFVISLICLTCSLVISFLLINTGLTFVGLVLMIIASIIINILVLLILYHFIVSKRGKKFIIFLTFIGATIMFGIGLGIMSIGITSFDIITDINSDDFIVEKKKIEMSDNLFFHDDYNLKFVESENDSLMIELYHSKITNFSIDKYNDSNMIGISFYENINGIDVLNTIIEDINNKKIIDYGNYEIIVYTNKENISKLNANKKDYELNNYYYDNYYYNIDNE